MTPFNKSGRIKLKKKKKKNWPFSLHSNGVITDYSFYPEVAETICSENACNLIEHWNFNQD